MELSKKLTEDETINFLLPYLQNEGWKIISHCLGQERGCDIIASRDEKTLYIEVKGARAGDNSPTKSRDFFDRGQIKHHFGVALVKALEDKYLNPTSEIAIAHPEDEAIIKAIGHLMPYLKKLGIRHFWVTGDGKVWEDNLD